MQEPLRKIQTFGSMVKNEFAAELTDKGCDYLDRIMKSAKRMSDMVKGLLDYSRVGANLAPFTTVDLTHLVKEVESDLEISMLDFKLNGQILSD